MSDAAHKQRDIVKEKIRFHLDEHVDSAISSALRLYGIDVTTTVEAGLRTADDNAQLDYARVERRVVVTHDPDFFDLARRSKDHAGIAYCKMKARSIGEIIRALIFNAG